MSIFGSCLPEPGKCCGKPLIALPDQSNGSTIYRLLVGLQREELSHRCRWEDNCSHLKWQNFCKFKSCPLDTPRNLIWWFISKPYLHRKILNRYSDISWAQLPKSTHSNSCVWPAGLVCTNKVCVNQPVCQPYSTGIWSSLNWACWQHSYNAGNEVCRNTCSHCLGITDCCILGYFLPWPIGCRQGRQVLIIL